MNKRSFRCIITMMFIVVTLLIIAIPSMGFAAEKDVKTYYKSKDGDLYLSKNFKVSEFACKDGSDKILIDPELVVILQNIRDYFGKPIIINSAYRTESWNKHENGASNSRHLYGMAADIKIRDISPTEIAKYAETIGVRGIGRYSTFVHVDTRSSKYYWVTIDKKTNSVKTHGGTYDKYPYENGAVTVSSIKVSAPVESNILHVGNSAAVTASVSPSNATNKSVKWSTSDSSIATVNSSGVVTAVAPGTATITATAADGSGKKGSVKIYVISKYPALSFISDKENREYMETMMQYYFGEYPKLNTALNKGKSVVFMFEGGSDLVNDSEFGSDYNKYRVAATCIVVRKNNTTGKPSITYYSERASTMPDYPLAYGEYDHGKSSVYGTPTIKDGIYSLYTTNHNNTYAAYNVRDSADDSAVSSVWLKNGGYAVMNAPGLNVRTRTTTQRSSKASDPWSAGSLMSSGSIAVHNEFIPYSKPSNAATKSATYSDTATYAFSETGIHAGELVLDRYLHRDVMKNTIYKNSSAVDEITSFSVNAYKNAVGNKTFNVFFDEIYNGEKEWNYVAHVEKCEDQSWMPLDVYIPPAREGYEFIGWSTEKDATVPKYTSDMEIYIESHLKLYSVWKEKSKMLEAPTITTAIKTISGKPVVKWSAVSGAAKYEVYRAASKSGTYTKMTTTTGTSYTNTSAVAGTTYYYKVCALDSKDNKGAFSTIKSITCDCAQPVVTVSRNSSGAPYVQWKAVSGASKYEVHRATSKNGTYKKMTTTTGTSYTNTNSTAGTTYYYKVKAICGKTTAGNSAFSDVKSIIRLCAKPVITVSRNSSGAPCVQWKAVSGASKYEVHRATSKNGTYKKMTTTTGTSYTNTNSTAGTTYYYKVKAICGKTTAGNSAFSDVKSMTRFCAQPAASVTIKASSGKPQVKWKAVSGAKKYEVYRAIGKNGSFTKLKETTGTSYTYTSAISGKAYYFKVRAVDAKGNKGAFSASKGVTCDCAQPVVSIALKASNGKPQLKWKAVPGASKYEIYRATSKSGKYTRIKETTGTSFTNTSAKAGKTYYYKVKAICGRSSGGNSAYSAVKSIKAK